MDVTITRHTVPAGASVSHGSVFSSIKKRHLENIWLYIYKIRVVYFQLRAERQTQDVKVVGVQAAVSLYIMTKKTDTLAPSMHTEAWGMSVEEREPS